MVVVLDEMARAVLNNHLAISVANMYLIKKINQLIIFCFPLLLILLHPVGSQLAAARSSGKAGSSSSTSRVVRYLPGLQLPGGGPLPFHLETGYIGVGESMDVQLFYYFVKSERNPKEDPVLLWFSGGPRCSSFSGLAFEIDELAAHPLNLVLYTSRNKNTTLNPHSWTKIANVVFLDTPVHAGFSYSESSSRSSTGDKESVPRIYEFLRKWLIDEYPDFQSNPLYIGGDSFAGMIIPIVVQELITDFEAGKYQFLNFKGYIIGNPVNDRRLETNSMVPFAHGLGLISNELYESMKENCKGNYVDFDPANVNCFKNREEFVMCTSGIEIEHILEPACDFDTPIANEMIGYRRSLITKLKEDFVNDSLAPPFPGCRNYDFLLSYYWANDDRVREALHIKKGTVETWLRCNYKLPIVRDIENNLEYHRNLSTKQGYKFLVYSGDHDMLVSHISTEAWIRSLNLSVADEWRPWIFRGQVAGYTRSYTSGMTYATIKGAGHTAPSYKPEECFAMFERWISHNPL